jgi:hypothetical protein
MAVYDTANFSTGNCPEGIAIDPNSSTYTERLFRLINAKLQLVESLHTLSKSQAALNPHDSMDTILGLIGRRDTIMDQIQTIQLQLREYQADDPERRTWISSERREECRRLSNQIQNLIQEILRWDGQALESMQHQRDAVANELRNGMDLQLAQRAYESFHDNAPSIIDVADL